MPNGNFSYYSAEIASEICERLASGRTLASICKDEDMPPRSTVYQWFIDNPEFKALYEEAKIMQVEAFVDEIFSIADDSNCDVIVDAKGNYRVDGEMVARSRLRVDTRKWYACKVYPKVYGDRVLPSGGQVNTGPKGVNNYDEDNI